MKKSNRTELWENSGNEGENRAAQCNRQSEQESHSFFYCQSNQVQLLLFCIIEDQQSYRALMKYYRGNIFINGNFQKLFFGIFIKVEFQLT